MQDAIDLIGRTLVIEEVAYKVKSFYFVPGTNLLYVGLQTPNKGVMNWRYEHLLPYFIEQVHFGHSQL